MNVIKGYQPENVFRYFEEISAIPRESGNEKQIADYLCNFAKAHDLRFYRDDLHNVVIYKDATSGYEDKPTVMLQAHTDMVCEKVNGSTHDFATQGISMMDNDGWLCADGTTLGGDDGAGVAIILGILDGCKQHPALECLFTSQEETGLFGAIAFDYSHLSATRIINLDSEEEGVATVSCAGGVDVGFAATFAKQPTDDPCVKLTLTGCKGGHSGVDIDKNRTNALLSVVEVVRNMPDARLVSIRGGNKLNAIPRDCEAVLSGVTEQQVSDAVSGITFAGDDSGAAFSVSKTQAADAFSTEDTATILTFLSSLPNGVLAYTEGFVETSSNLGVIKTEGENITVSCFSRSSVDAALDALEDQMRKLGDQYDFACTIQNRSPGWALNPKSTLQSDFIRACNDLFPEWEPKIEAIHAGLECGAVLAGLGGGDAISIGPDMRDVHTPSEQLSLPSCERIYKLVEELLKR